MGAAAKDVELHAVANLQAGRDAVAFDIGAPDRIRATGRSTLLQLGLPSLPSASICDAVSASMLRQKTFPAAARRLPHNLRRRDPNVQVT